MRSAVDLVLLVIGLSLAPGSMAQRTIVVSGGGGGGAINAAIAVAQAGDRLLVRAGVHAPVWSNKGVSVLCDQGVVFDGVPSLGTFQIPAGQTFLLRGGVTFRRCTLPPLVVDRSHVELHDCSHTGSGIPTLATLHLESGAVVTVISGVVQGRPNLPPIGAMATPAAPLASGAKLTIGGDASTVFVAGASSVGASVPAILAGAGTLVVDPDATLRGTASPPIVGGASVTIVQVPGSTTTESQPGVFDVTVKHAGVPGDRVYTLASWIVTPTNSPFGTLWIDPNAVLVDGGATGPGGLRTFQVRLPAILPATPISLQTFAIVQSGSSLVLGIPETLTAR